jgi:hypothetical protein
MHARMHSMQLFIEKIAKILPFFSPSPSGGGWTQTLALGMTRQMFYHCATVVGPTLDNLLCYNRNLHL